MEGYGEGLISETNTHAGASEVAEASPEIGALSETSLTPEVAPLSEAPAFKAEPLETTTAPLVAEDDSSYAEVKDDPAEQAVEALEPEDDPLFAAPPETAKATEEALEPEADPAAVDVSAGKTAGQTEQTTSGSVSSLAEMAKLEPSSSAVDAIESVNKPLGEQMRDTENRTVSEVSLSPGAQASLRDGTAASKGLVETIPSEVVAPVRTDSREHAQADLENNRSRIVAEQAIAARNTAANVEAALNRPDVAVENAPQTIETAAENKEGGRYEDVKSIPGHGDSRHGKQVTEAQHEERLETGKTPDGVVEEKRPKSSTSFYSDEAQLEAVNKAVDHFSALSPAEMPIRVNSQGEAKLARDSTTIASDSSEGFGWGLRKREGVIERVDNLNEARVVMDHDPRTGQFTTPRTQFPDGK